MSQTLVSCICRADYLSMLENNYKLTHLDQKEISFDLCLSLILSLTGKEY